jgi:hypothetical protein
MRRVIIAIFLVLAGASSAWADVAFDASTQDIFRTSSSFSFSHTTTGNQRYLTVAGAVNSVDSTGVTYNSVSMSLKSRSTSGSLRSEIYELVNPASGSNSVAVTLPSSQSVICRAVSFTGVNPSTPTGTASTNALGSGTSNTATVTASATGMCLDALVTANAASAHTANTGQVNTSIVQGGGDIDQASSTEPGSTCSVQGWSWTTSAVNGIVVVPINAASSAHGFPLIFQ